MIIANVRSNVWARQSNRDVWRWEQVSNQVIPLFLSYCNSRVCWLSRLQKYYGWGCCTCVYHLKKIGMIQDGGILVDCWRTHLENYQFLLRESEVVGESTPFDARNLNSSWRPRFEASRSRRFIWAHPPVVRCSLGVFTKTAQRKARRKANVK